MMTITMMDHDHNNQKLTMMATGQWWWHKTVAAV
jgi:hypothetical protein